MTCSSCGADVPADARFCPACGTAVEHGTSGEGPPPTVEEAGDRLVHRGVLLAAATFLGMVFVVVTASLLLLILASVASVAALYHLVQGWGVRHGSLWALDELPDHAQDDPAVRRWFWGDEHCPGCGEVPDEADRYCPSCGHAIWAPPEPALKQVGHAFARLVKAQPVEPARSQAFRDREPHETSDRWFLIALALVVGGYAVTTVFGAFFLDVLGVTLATLVPPVVILVWLRTQDRFEPEPWALMVLAFGWGILSALFVIPLNTLFISLGLWASVAGLTEELAKAAILVFLASHRALRKEFNGPTDGLIYGGCAGLGFAAVENIDYVLSISALTGDFLAAMAIRTTLVFNHMFWTGITGGYLGLMMLRHGRAGPRDLLIGFWPAAVLHGLNNAPWTDWLGGFGLFVTPIVVTVSGYAFFKLLADALRDEQAWGYDEGQAPVEEGA